MSRTISACNGNNATTPNLTVNFIGKEWGMLYEQNNNRIHLLANPSLSKKTDAIHKLRWHLLSHNP